MKTTVKDLCIIGVMSALVCVATLAIMIPTGLSIGYVHMGDSMVFLAAILLGKKKGVLASAIGMGLADLLAGYAYYIPFTVVIKAIMALIVAVIVWKRGAEKSIGRIFIGCTLGGIWMVFGYYLTKIFMLKVLFSKVDSIKEAAILSLESVPPNIGQFVVGMIIAIPIALLLKDKLKLDYN